MHIYHIAPFLVCSAACFRRFSLFLFGFLDDCLHPLDLFATHQRQQLFHLAATHSHKGIMLFHVYLPHILTRQATFLIQETDNVWSNGNLIKGSTLNMDYGGEYTYLDKEDKVNVSFYGGAITPKFKGHTSKNYISIVRTKYAITYFEYTFDSEGYPTTMTETQISNNDSHLSQYIFTYYE